MSQRKFEIPLTHRLLQAIAAGLLLAAAFPPWSMPLLCPMGITLWAIALRGSSLRHAAYVGLTAGCFFYFSTLFWLFKLFQTGAIGLIFIVALFPMIFSILYVKVASRFPFLPSWLIFAVMWTGIEYFRSEPFPLNFGWMGLGYALIDSPLFGALASIGGCYAITFWIAAFGASIEGLRGRNAGAKAGTGLLVAIWIFAIMFQPEPPMPNNPLSVLLVQAGAEDDENFAKLSNTRGDRHYDFVVWPEYAFLMDPTRQPILWKKLRQVAIDADAHLIFGAKETVGDPDQNQYRNTAFMLDPKGNLIGKHVKNHTVHFVTDGIKGREAKAIQTSSGKIGVAICYDMDYPDVARRLAEDGAEVFLVPNMDPAEWGTVQRLQHRLMFQMRAAECGKWLARADVAGGTSTAAPTGQQVDRVITTDPVRLPAMIGRDNRPTPFLQGGWRFGQFCLLGTLLLSLSASHRRRSRQSIK